MHTSLDLTRPMPEASARAASRHAAAGTRRSVGKHVAAAVTLAVLALQPWAAVAHETDQYTLPVGREFADLGPHFSRVFYNAIVDAVDGTNAAIKRSLRDNHPSEAARLQSTEVIANEVWLQLFLAFPSNELLDGGLVTDRVRTRYPGLITVYRPEQWIYDDPLLVVDLTKIVRSTFRACTVSADGKLFGTDKIIHFINLGRIYHSKYLSARKHGVAESEAVSQAVHLSAGKNLFLSEGTMLGMYTTGIWSNADLAANYAGFKFYRNLTEEVRIGNQVMPPILVKRGTYWRVNDQVQPDSDFFTAYITPHWNEALNPNVYASVTDTRVRSMVRSRCLDARDWYRDEHGRPLTRAEFAEIEAELSTFYGEEYGYRSDAKSEISIATTCFESGQPDANTLSADADQVDLRLQKAFGLQSGWGQHAGTEVPASDQSQGPAVDRYGRTQLWWAAKDGRLEDVERMLQEGANPNAPDIDGEMPLHAAARWGQVAIAEVLLSHGADPGAKAANGATPLQVSVVEAQVGTARALLRHGADANARDLFGKSPLHDAALRGNRDLVALLLDYGADARATDDSGTTPLHLAARGGNKGMMKVLLSHKADPRARNLAGATPYDEAQQQGYTAILQELTSTDSGQRE
jgi:ankyrin repeat protein